jgi:hypothetical protein
MAVLTPGLFTYSEWAARMDPDGKTSLLINLLSQQNAILEDCMAVECQSGNAFEFTQVVKLPTPARRSYNTGVAATMAGVAKQVQTCIEYADLVKMDKSLANLGGNLNDLRGKEDAMHLEGLGQLVASDLFYGNRATDPTQFTGLANIYNTVSTNTSLIAKNVIDMGGTSNTNASIWMVTWGPDKIHTIFPKGIPAGMQHQDMGIQLAYDANGNPYPAYHTWIQQNIGLCIHDWRYCARAANIDVTLLSGGSAANLIACLTALANKLPTTPYGVGPVQTNDDPFRGMMGRSAIYMCRTIYEALDQQAQNKTNVLLKMEEWDGHAVLTWRGVPIRICDSLTTTESRVV